MDNKPTLYLSILCICFWAISFNSYSQNDKKSTKESANSSADDHDYIEQGGGSGSGSSGGMASSDENIESSESFDALGTLHSLAHTNSMQLMNIDLTGQVDNDYPKVMAAHHKDAIEMAELYLTAGINTQLREMAEKMISTKQRHLEKMMPFIIETNSATGADTSVVLLEPVQKMMDKPAMQSSNELDQDFVTMMIDHNRSGAEISDIVLKKGTRQELQTLAMEIKEDQKMEAEELLQWQNKRKK